MLRCDISMKTDKCTCDVKIENIEISLCTCELLYRAMVRSEVNDEEKTFCITGNWSIGCLDENKGRYDPWIMVSKKMTQVDHYLIRTQDISISREYCKLSF